MLPFVVANLGRLLDATTTDALRECRCTFVFRHCLATNHVGYDKFRDFAEMFDVVAEAASWARQRHVAAAVFGTPGPGVPTARLLVPVFDHAAAVDADSPEGVEMEDVFMRYSLDVAYASAFNVDLNVLSVAAASAPVPAIGQANRVASEATLLRHIVPSWWWRLMRWLNVGAERTKAVLDEFFYRVTDRERDQLLRDSAAKDLIMVALTWRFCILCTHPDVEAKILNDFPQPASYLHAAVLQTLRLFPPAPFEEKEAVRNDVLPAGSLRHG
nr:unnamed protein product [Digitaria exilis]